MTKFLIIRFSSIGDIVLTSPVARVIKNKYPDSQVHFVTKSSFDELVKYNPNIDCVHLLKDDLEELIQELKSEYFDYVVDLHDNIRSSIIKRKLGVPAFTYDKQRWKRWLLVNLKIDKMGAHIVDRYVSSLSPLGIESDGLGIDYYIGPKDEVLLSSLPKRFQNKYAVMVVGTSFFTKQLPLCKQIEICKGLKCPVLLLGGKIEKPLGDEIVANSGEHVFNACGLYSINQCASLIKQSLCVISNDTGLMHIAAAYSKPIMATYGNSVTSFGFDPYKPNAYTKIFEVNIPCRPCSKFGKNKCPKKHFKCMNDIQTAQIIDSVNVLF